MRNASRVSQNAVYEAGATFAHTSAATTAATRMTALDVSVWTNARSGAPRPRAHRVLASHRVAAGSASVIGRPGATAGSARRDMGAA